MAATQVGKGELDFAAEDQANKDANNGYLGADANAQVKLTSLEGLSPTLDTLTLTSGELKLRDTNDTHDFIIKMIRNLANDYTLNIDTPINGSNTLVIAGDCTLDDWFDQSVKAEASPAFEGVFIDSSLTPAVDAYYRCENDQGSRWASGLRASTDIFTIEHDPDGLMEGYFLIKPDGKVGMGDGISSTNAIWNVTIKQTGAGNDALDIFGDTAGLVIHNGAGTGSGTICGGADAGKVHAGIGFRDLGASTGQTIFGVRNTSFDNDLDIAAFLTEDQFFMTNSDSNLSASYMEVLELSSVPTATTAGRIPIYGWGADSTLRARIDGVEEIILTDTKDPDLKAGVVYRVNGTQVVGAQQAGIVDADGTLADITLKFNNWLAKAETHGLLAVL